MARSRGDRNQAPPKPKSDAYVGLLGISFVALVVGCVLLLLDRLEYPETKPAGAAPQYSGPPIAREGGGSPLGGVPDPGGNQPPDKGGPGIPMP